MFKLWLAALGFLLFGQSVFAVDYYWTTQGYESKGHFSSPSSACSAVYTSWSDGHLIKLTKSYSSLYYCDVRQSSNYYTLYVYRYGDSCPSGATYNDATGSCDAPEQSLCQQAQGSKTIYWFETNLASPLPDSIDINGCVGKLSGILSCPVQSSGDGVCSGEFVITGDETAASIPVAGTGNDCSSNCEPPYPQTESTELPCDPVTDPATGAQVCTSESHFSEPGTSTCTSSGSLVCVENPKSRSQDKTVETTTQQTANADGSTSTTTTTTTTKTDCLGIGGCTSTTSTETTSGGTKADGSTKPETVTCTGSGCQAPEDLPEDESASDLPSGELSEPSERGNFDAELAEWDQLIADSRVDLRSKLDQMAELVTAETSLSLSGTSGRLYCQSVNVPALGSSFELCLDEYQDELVGLKWILIFMASVLAFYIIFVRD
ncbi:hypothetical protein [Azotobacter beijerinckii]|uniref:hypothetical protein n=1 Tax=Azotobacter beijerinckii TaxID=170623 RepID=UPI00111453FC|nr:hypothetical protein [Azotobacter beijerinckii]